MQFLLVFKRGRQAVPKGSAHQKAEDAYDDCVGFGAALLRVIEAWAAVVDVFASHERTRGRAHAQQYAVGGIPCQRFFLLFLFFLGLLVTLVTAST